MTEAHATLSTSSLLIRLYALYLPLRTMVRQFTPPITVLCLYTAKQLSGGSWWGRSSTWGQAYTAWDEHTPATLRHCVGLKRMRMCLYCLLWLMVWVSKWVRGTGVQCSVWEVIIHGVQRLVNNSKTARQLTSVYISLVTSNIKPDHSFYEQNKGRNNPLAIEGMANYH